MIEMNSHTVNLRHHRDGTFTLAGLTHNDLDVILNAVDHYAGTTGGTEMDWLAALRQLVAGTDWISGAYTKAAEFPWVDR